MSSENKKIIGILGCGWLGLPLAKELVEEGYIVRGSTTQASKLDKIKQTWDYKYPSKILYVAFPMVHDTLPIVKTKSYLDFPQLTYFRLPGFQKVARNEIVVFSWPADTVRQFFVKEKGVRKPIDKKSNYVKRCVGIPGDTLSIVDGFVYINGERSILPERAKTQYIHTAYRAKGIYGRKLQSENFKDFTRKYRIDNISNESYQALLPYIYGIYSNERDNFVVISPAAGIPVEVVRKLRLKMSEILESQKELLLTVSEADRLNKVMKLDSIVRQVNRSKTPNTSFFPNHLPYDWNEDNQAWDALTE